MKIDIELLEDRQEANRFVRQLRDGRLVTRIDKVVYAALAFHVHGIVRDLMREGHGGHESRAGFIDVLGMATLVDILAGSSVYLPVAPLVPTPETLPPPTGLDTEAMLDRWWRQE